MRALFDVNALLGLLDKDHMFHDRIRAWWSANQSGGWATCPITQNGFVRIISQPRHASPRSIRSALETLRLATSQPGHQFWPDDVSIVKDMLVDGERVLGPNQITDIYLLALAVKHGGRLVTFDAGMSVAAVRGAAKDNCVML